MMVMSTGVDGGGIIGHFLPAIQSGDTPNTLFQKTIGGAPEMYKRFLDGFAEQTGPLTPIPQPRPLFYTRDVDLGWHLKIMIMCQQRRDTAARFERVEKMVEYWREPDSDRARKLYRQTIDTLLWGAAASA